MAEIIIQKCSNCGEVHTYKEDIYVCRECEKEICKICFYQHRDKKCKD